MSSSLPIDEPLLGVAIKDEPSDSLLNGINDETEDSTVTKVNHKEGNTSEVKRGEDNKFDAVVKAEVRNLTEVLKETLVPATNCKSEEGSSCVDDNPTVKLENVMKEAKEDPQDDPVAQQHLAVRNSVVELLKESGYAEKATKENINRILGWLMKGILPTEAELHSLFNPPSDVNDVSASVLNPESCPEEPPKRSTEKNTECSAVKTNRRGRRKTRTVSKQQPVEIDDSTSSGSLSPPHLSPVKDAQGPEPDKGMPASPPRYSLRRKKRTSKSLSEDLEGSGPSPEDFYDNDDSDDWTPYQSKKESEAFLYTTRKRSRHGLADKLLAMTRKRASSQNKKDNNEKSQRSKRRRVDNASPEDNNINKDVVPKPGKVVVTQNKIARDKKSALKATSTVGVFACTKCVLAYCNKSFLQRHMFRLHYDEFLRLRGQNYWDGVKL